MRRTFLGGNLPIAKHFARRGDGAHRFGATHRSSKSKALQDADISKGSPILLKADHPLPRVDAGVVATNQTHLAPFSSSDQIQPFSVVFFLELANAT